MTVLLKRNSSLIAKLALTLLIVASSVFVTSTSADAISVSSSANPAWPNKCGIKIGLLIDRSNSISSGDGATLKTAAKGFVDALAGTSSQIAVAQFRKTATQTLGLTSVFDAAGQTTVKNTIDGYTFGTSDSSGSTNWEAAFYSQQSVSADVVIILTDGNPTQRNIDGSGGNGSSDGSDFNIDAGITRANELKAQGKRVVAVGIGNDVDSTNLAAVSGPTLNDDYFTSSFATLNTKLTQIASTICGGTVTVQKQVKNSDGSYTATNGWDYTATNAVNNSKTTAGSGTAEFKFENAPKTTTITETLKAGYVLESISCTKNGQATGSVQGLGVTLTVNANDIISCIYKNKPTTGKVIVTKQVKNSDGSYTATNGWDYTATNAVDNSKTTAGSGTAQFEYEVTPKATTITETVKAGYSVESVTCLNGNQTVATSSNASVNLTVPTDGTINCYFKNKQDSANLTIKKVATGGSATFGFTSNTVLGNFNLDGNTQTSTVAIPVGSFNVTETALSGWSLDSASCTGTNATKNGSQLSFTSTKDADIVCTFTNSRDTANVTVTKKTIGGDGEFSFETTVPTLGNFNLTTVGGTKSTPVAVVPTGTYDIKEVVPANWNLTDITCVGNNSGSLLGTKATIVVTKGANITCTFTNTRQTASLTVIKKSVGGDDTFGFTSTSNLGDFSLTTVGGTKSTSATQIPVGSSFEISENVKSGWTLTDITCTGNTSGIISGRKVTITPAVSQNIVCTFTNTRDTGSLTVVKNASGANGTFGFESNTPLGNFSLTTVLGTASTQTISVPTGNYSLAEVVPAGWALSSKSCTDSVLNANGPVTSSNASGFTISVTKGSNITCTFNNTRDAGTIQIIKKTTNEDGTFTFTSNTPLGSFEIETGEGTGQTATVSAPTGSYEISESSKEGWSLDSISCTGGEALVDETSVTVSVTKGAVVTCTFTNSLDTGTITVIKNVVSAGGVSDGTFDFYSNPDVFGADGGFTLETEEGTASTKTVEVPAGYYNIGESVPDGWTLTSQDCTGTDASEDGGLYFKLEKGADVVCTFTNTRDTGDITIVKEVNEAGGVTDGTFNFTSDIPGLAKYQITTQGGSGASDALTVPTGSYNIDEIVPQGWSLDSVSCIDQNADDEVVIIDGPIKAKAASASAEVTAGSDFVCTFTNTRETLTLQVVENAIGGDDTFPFTLTTSEEAPLEELGGPVSPEALSDLAAFNLVTVAGTKSTAVITIPTGTYDLSQTNPTGWTLTNISCVGATNPIVSSPKVSFTGTSGQAIVCTFVNTKTQVQGTVVTRPTDTIVPPVVKGISVGSLPTTGATTQALLAIVVSLLASGGIFFAASRKRKAL